MNSMHRKHSGQGNGAVGAVDRGRTEKGPVCLLWTCGGTWEWCGAGILGWLLQSWVMASVTFPGRVWASINHFLIWPAQYPGTERRLCRTSLFCCAGKEDEAQIHSDTCPRSHSSWGRARILTLVPAFLLLSSLAPHHSPFTGSVCTLHLGQSAGL